MSTTTANNGHVPTGPRRGGYSRRGGGRQGGAGGGAGGNAAQQFVDDTDETRALRQKYGDKLSLLKELFADWSDEDLLSVLAQSGGEIELAVGRISEGHAEQFSSVKSKSARKKETSAHSGANGATQAATAGKHANRNASHATTEASARGTRGGPSGRGARGGSRGGTRGGRGGGPTPQANGHVTSASISDLPSTTAPTSTGPSWAQAIAAAQKKPAAGAVAPPIEVVAGEVSEVPVEAASEAVVVETAVPAAAIASWDDDTPEQPTAPTAEKEAAKEDITAAKAGSKTIPKGSKMSWAQIARPVEPPKPKPAPVPALVSAAVPEVAPVAEPIEAVVVEEDVVPEDTAEPVVGTAITVVEEAPIEASASQADPAQHAIVTTEVVTQEEAPEAAPSQPVVSLPPSAEPTGQAAAVPAKPGYGRAGLSQRAIQRSRQDVPVAVSGDRKLDSLGVQFGNISFLGADDDAEEAPPAAAEPAPVAAPLQQQNAFEAQPKAELDPAIVDSRLAAQKPPQPSQPQVATSQPAQLSQQAQSAAAAPDTFTQPSSNSYEGYKHDGFASPAQGFSQQAFTQQQQPQPQTQQPHQAPQQQPAQQPHQVSQQQQSDPYGAYSGLASQQQSQQAAYHSQYQDYYGGLDSQRLASLYGGYDQNSASNAFGTRQSDDRAQNAGQHANASQAQATGTDQQGAQGGVAGSVGLQGQQGQHAHQPSQTQGQQTPQQHGGVAPQQQQQQQQQQQHQPQPQPQQQYPGIMPYYYPHYYLPNQFQQHYGQPTAAGYNQYLYAGAGAQQPHKPGTPASLQSPYSTGPESGYGSQSGYAQSPATSLAGASAYDSQAGGFGQRGVPTHGANSDYSKIYGGGAGSLPGLGGFLGGPPSHGLGNTNGSSGGGTAGTPHTQPQQAAGAQGQNKVNPGQSSGLDAYRGYDGKPSGGGSAATGANAVGRGPPPHQLQQQQGQQQHTPQQQQQQGGYYQQQYSGYGHQPTGSANYGGGYGYGNRQYWGQ